MFILLRARFAGSLRAISGRHSLAICHHYLLSTSVLIGTISSVTRLSSKDDVVSAAARPMHPPAGRRDNSSGSIYDIGIAIRHGVPGRGDRRSSRHRPNRPPPSSPSVVSDATTTRVSHYRRTRYAGAIGSPDSYALEDERAGGDGSPTGVLRESRPPPRGREKEVGRMDERGRRYPPRRAGHTCRIIVRQLE